MSNNININSITNNINNSQNNSVKKKDSERDLLEEFSQILGKITSAVKSSDKSSSELAKAFQTVEIKREAKNIQKNNGNQDHLNKNEILRVENNSRSEEVQNKQRTYENDYVDYPADSFIEKEQVEFSQDEEIEVNKLEEQVVEEEVVEEDIAEESLNAGNDEILEEIFINSEITEVNASNAISIKTDNEINTEVTNETIVVSEVVTEKAKGDESKELDLVANNQLQSESKNLEVQTQQDDQKLKEVNLEKNAVASESVVSENTSESIEIETLKTKVITELDKKLVSKDDKTKIDSKEVVSEEAFEEVSLLANQQISRNIPTQTVLENSQLNVSVNTQENAMKSIINQAKDVLTKQLDFKFSSNNANTNTQVSIQNVQANINSKSGEVLNKDSKPLALPRTYANRTISKVEEVIKELSKSKDGKTISVRLDPPSLGSVKVDVSYKDGALTARVMAESSQVGQFLKDKAVDLQQLLRKSGINVEEVNVWFGSQSEFSDSSESKSFDDFENNFNERNFQSDDLGIEGEITSQKQKENEVLDHWVA